MKQLFFIVVLLISHKICFEKGWTKMPSKFLLSDKTYDNIKYSIKFSFKIIIINNVIYYKSI